MCLFILERWCSWTATYTSSACKLYALLSYKGDILLHFSFPVIYLHHNSAEHQNLLCILDGSLFLQGI